EHHAAADDRQCCHRPLRSAIRPLAAEDRAPQCPPNFLRIACRVLHAKTSSPRDVKRWYSEAVSTVAGTPSSMAARTVHRPSPESGTSALTLASSGSSASAEAVRSSSQEATTLPRRHSSVISARLKSYWKCSGFRSGVTSALAASRPFLPTLAFLMTLRPSA